MPRNHHNYLGVGRGNGAGSQRTQFQAGGPSGNPKGRPRKRRLPPATSLLEVLQRLLGEVTDVSVGEDEYGEPLYTKRMRRLDALGESMMSKLGNASLREQTAFIRQLGGFDSVALRASVPSLVPDLSVFEDLRKEAERDIALGVYPDPRVPPPNDDQAATKNCAGNAAKSWGSKWTAPKKDGNQASE
jgi:hypothetical protein